jgi:hypothetical protein
VKQKALFQTKVSENYVGVDCLEQHTVPDQPSVTEKFIQKRQPRLADSVEVDYLQSDFCKCI